MINSKQLDALIDAGAVKAVSVEGTAGGFTVCIDGKLIEAMRGHARVFRKLDTAASFLRIKGISEFTVSVAQWTPAQKAIL